MLGAKILAVAAAIMLSASKDAVYPNRPHICGSCVQIAENTRPTIHAPTAHPEPVKKPTQNQTPIW